MPIISAAVCDPDVPANVLVQLRRMTGEMCQCGTDACQHMSDSELVQHLGQHQIQRGSACGCGDLSHGCQFGFDLYVAAADIWRYKAQCVAHCAEQYSVDGQTIHDTRFDRYMQVAADYDSRRGIGTMYLSRHGRADEYDDDM